MGGLGCPDPGPHLFGSAPQPYAHSTVCANSWPASRPRSTSSVNLTRIRAAIYRRAAVAAGIYGGLVVLVIPRLATALPSSALALLLAGGLLYTVGAVVYALKRPDPLPKVFGYHEIFHAFVVLAAVCHYAVVARVVTALH